MILYRRRKFYGQVGNKNSQTRLINAVGIIPRIIWLDALIWRIMQLADHQRFLCEKIWNQYLPYIALMVSWQSRGRCKSFGAASGILVGITRRILKVRRKRRMIAVYRKKDQDAERRRKDTSFEGGSEYQWLVHLKNWGPNWGSDYLQACEKG